jgi:hypothetical protein
MREAAKAHMVKIALKRPDEGKCCKKQGQNEQLRVVFGGGNQTAGGRRMKNRFTMLQTSKRGIQWCRFRVQKGNSG